MYTCMGIFLVFHPQRNGVTALKHHIYLDNAATTPMRKEVLEVMLPYLTEQFGNPSSIHAFGREAKRAIERARKQVAQAIGATPREIYFTSGGSESDNWAIQALCHTNAHKGKHIITSTIEHHAILHTCAHMEKNGYEITYIPVDQHGVISPESVKNALRKDTVLVTLMAANNEIGTLQPMEEIGRITKEAGVLFHTDAVQAIGSIEVDVQKWNVDLLSLSAHKFYGPKGVGALYIRKGIAIENLLFGGAQERGLRAGTENVANIVGLGEAISLATNDLVVHSETLTRLREQLINGILSQLPDVQLNGHPQKRLPGNVNFSFQRTDGEAVLMRLDLLGIAGASGSACTSGNVDPSHVLLAIGLSPELAQGSLRLSLGRFNTQEDIATTITSLVTIVQELRAMQSPTITA